MRPPEDASLTRAAVTSGHPPTPTMSLNWSMSYVHAANRPTSGFMQSYIDFVERRENATNFSR